MSHTWSQNACDSGLRRITDDLCDAHREALAVSFENDEETVEVNVLRTILHERGVNWTFDASEEAAIEHALAVFVAKTLRDVSPSLYEYEAGLGPVGRALDEWYDEAYSAGEEAGSESCYESGHEDGYKAGREEAREEHEEVAAVCPTCLAPELQEEDRTGGKCRCGRCKDVFLLVPAHKPYVVNADGAWRAGPHESLPATKQEYLAKCGLESAPLSAGEER